MNNLKNLPVEQAFLGALLDDNNLREMAPGVSPHHFHEPLHRQIAEDIFAQITAGRTADAHTLRDRFKDSAGYLLQTVQAGHISQRQFVEYGRTIVDLSARRGLQEAGKAMLSDLEAGYDALAVAGAAEARLRAIPIGDTGGGDVSAEACLMAYADAPPGLRSSYDNIDKRMGGLHPGDLVLIAGRPSMGKSSLARNLAFAIAWRGHKIHFASLEMSAGQLYARAASAMSYDTNARFAHRALRSQDGSYDRAQLAAFAARMPTTIRIDSRGGQTLPMLEASARETRRRLGGLDAIFVDYLQIMRALTSENRVQQITEISAGLKALAMNMGVPVVALSQLSRANESRDDKRPQLSDLRDSGSLEQDADVVMAVYREAYYVEREEPQEASYADEHAFMTAWTRWDERKRAAGNTLEVITLKQRHGEIGTDLFDFFPAYDVINEKERPRAALRVVR